MKLRNLLTKSGRYVIRLMLLLLPVALPVAMSACTGSKKVDPETLRLQADLQKTQEDITKLEQRAKDQTQGGYQIQADIELARSRLERLRERLNRRANH